VGTQSIVTAQQCLQTLIQYHSLIIQRVFRKVCYLSFQQQRTTTTKGETIMAKMNKAELITRCADLINRAIVEEQNWLTAHNAAVSIYGKSAYTSGLGFAADSPDSVKDVLRAYNRESDALKDQSLKLWIKNGRRSHTWRALRDYLYFG
jgi:hypothetical protein